MYNLTDEEKGRVEAEESFRADIRRTIEGASKKERHWIFQVLNSAFCVTFLGAVFIALLGHWWQQQSIKEQRILVHWEAIQEKKLDLLSSFTQDVEGYIVIIGSLRKHRLAYEDAKVEMEKNAVDDKLVTKFNEARTNLGKTSERYLAAPKFDAYYVRIRALYTDESVHNALDQLNAAQMKLQQSLSSDEVDRNMQLVSGELDATAKAMGEEVRRRGP